jgi:hypothetical protein
MRVSLCLAAAAVLAAGCASKSADVAPSYVSPMQYQHYDCQQLTAEGKRVSMAAHEAAGVQASNRTKDVVATTVGVVVLWPVLFAVSGDNAKTAELARLKGEMGAIEQASIQKRCGISFRQAQQ